MYPIYKFYLYRPNVSDPEASRAYPIYKDDLAIDFEKESNQEFFRRKLSGKLTFIQDDYTFIKAQPFDFEFTLEIFISYDNGQTWTSYWNGAFWKTDCEFDDDTHTVVVKPTVVDDYNDVIAGLDKEYNLIELAPAIVQIRADKRPMIQVYVPGQTVIGCFLSGMWWEQECNAVEESDTVQEGGQTYQALTHKYHFAKVKTQRIIEVSHTGNPTIPDVFMGPAPSTTPTPPVNDEYEYTNGGYKLKYQDYNSGGYRIHYWTITDVSTNTVMWQYQVQKSGLQSLPYTVTLQPVSGTGATGTVELYVHDISVYARFVCDTEYINSLQTYEIPSDDIVPNNRNYHRVIGYNFPDTIAFNDTFSATPTQWGLYQTGKYYLEPYSIYGAEFFPIARNGWGIVSYWFTFSTFDWIVEQSGRQPFLIRNAYPLWSVISVLLDKVAPGITFLGTSTYSQFLYDTNPITNVQQHLCITPKSNIVTSGFDQPAQKAPITLKTVFDMLRDCFRCYWFIDSSKRLRIEHIQYFRNGGSYSGTPAVGVDLTKEIVSRNGKPWAFARNQFSFDKPDMAARYQFGWMDDVTQLFEGYPIDIVSKYVNPDNIQNIDIAKFTSDIDYILLNPSEISMDGFVLLSAIQSLGQYKLPYITFTIDGQEHVLQNAYVAFYFLTQYYSYDMPAYEYKINDELMYANGIKKLKRQSIRFPMLTDPDLLKLVKTFLGNGKIEKMSVNLSSRNANTTLIYDTE